VDTNCTAPSLIPTVNGNTVRSFSTHGQQSAAKGSSTTVSRSDTRLIQYLDSSARGLVRRWRLIGYFPNPRFNPEIPKSHDSQSAGTPARVREVQCRVVWGEGCATRRCSEGGWSCSTGVLQLGTCVASRAPPALVVQQQQRRRRRVPRRAGRPARATWQRPAPPPPPPSPVSGGS
jgi:hypothetical protein